MIHSPASHPLIIYIPIIIIIITAIVIVTIKSNINIIPKIIMVRLFWQAYDHYHECMMITSMIKIIIKINIILPIINIMIIAIVFIVIVIIII